MSEVVCVVFCVNISNKLFIALFEITEQLTPVCTSAHLISLNVRVCTSSLHT